VSYSAATLQRTIYCDGVQVAQDTAAAYTGTGKTLLAASTSAQRPDPRIAQVA
jgi:hypothetical protein